MSVQRPRSVMIDDALFERISQAALRQSSKQGKSISTSAWIRQACEERLDGVTVDAEPAVEASAQVPTGDEGEDDGSTVR